MVTCYLCSQVLEGMSEKIRMGIEAAETGLSKEKEKKQQEEVNALGSKLPHIIHYPSSVMLCVLLGSAGAVEICAHCGVSVELVLPTDTHHTRGTHIQSFLRFVSCLCNMCINSSVI